MNMFLAILCIPIALVNPDNNKLGRGFGDNIDWTTYAEGKQKSAEQNKIMMIIFHSPWCSACSALKPIFAGSSEIQKLSKNFVMVNIENDEELGGAPPYNPDGVYIPRIFFIDSSGELIKDIYNEDGNSHYKYYYSNAETVVQSMEKALTHFSNPASNLRVDGEL